MLHLLDNLPKPLAGFGAAPQTGFQGQSPLTSPAPVVPFPRPAFDSPLSPQAVYGGESAERLYAPPVSPYSSILVLFSNRNSHELSPVR